MEIEDFFEKKYKQRNHHHYNNYGTHGHENDPPADIHLEHQFRSDDRYNIKHDFAWQSLLAKIKSNPLLRMAAIAAGIGAVIIIILLIVVLHPIVSSIWETFTSSGLQGLLDKLMKG